MQKLIYSSSDKVCDFGDNKRQQAGKGEGAAHNSQTGLGIGNDLRQPAEVSLPNE